MIVSDRAPGAARLKEDFPEMFLGSKKKKKKKKERERENKKP